MGRVVVTEFISLDGVIQAPGDPSEFERGGWARGGGDESMQFKLEELMASDAQLLGRTTYEGFARAWPTMEGTGSFGEKMNGMPKFVASTTLRDPDWTNTAVLQGDLAQEVGALKHRYDGDILVGGSSQLVQSLLELNLVDELRLMVFPVVLGKGKRLFGDTTEPKALDLIDSKPLEDGVFILTYRPSANGSSSSG
jgi:dihydrofolate reductase